MKATTRWVHTLVRFLRLEPVIIPLTRPFPFLTKVLTLPEEYQPRRLQIIKRAGVRFKVDRSDYMQWHLYVNLPDLSWRVAYSLLSDNCVVLDIGANCGQFAIKLAGVLGNKYFQFTIHAFEPNPSIFELLQTNIGLNPDLRDRIQTHSLALGHEEGRVAFTFNPSNSGGGAVEYSERLRNISVDMKRLDDVVRTLNLSRVDFIKMDVEGFEPEVFWGGFETIERFRPALYIEMTETWFQLRGHSVKEIIDHLRMLKYSLWGEHECRFIPYLENEEIFSTLHQFNLLAKPALIEK